MRCVAAQVVLLDGSGETLVLLGIVVLQCHLQLHSLPKPPLLLLRPGEDGLHHLTQLLSVQLTEITQKFSDMKEMYYNYATFQKKKYY